MKRQQSSVLGQILFIIFLTLFLIPYFFVFSFLDLNVESFSTFFKILPTSFAQAIVSALATLIFGLWSALGLFWLERSLPKYSYAMGEFLCLLPSLLPAIFLIIATITVTPHFPFNIGGVIFLHTLGEVGVIAVVLKRILSQRLSPLSEYGFLSGSSPLFFLKKCAPLISKDILQLGIILVAYFLTSFSIPLLVAGSSSSTLEVAIYQQIVMNHNWSLASSLLFLQILFIFFLMYLTDKIYAPQTQIVSSKKMHLLWSSTGVIPLFLPVFILVFGLLFKLPTGLRLFFLQQEVWAHWKEYVFGSLLIGFLVAGFTFMLLTMTSYLYQLKGFSKVITKYLTPSYVAVSFGFLLASAQINIFPPVLISWALAIIFLPALFRFGVLQIQDSLKSQSELSDYMGGSRMYTFRRIIFPQVLPQISLMSGLSGVWAVGDFSMSRVIVAKDVSLAMWVQSLAEQYRWDLASLFSWLILLCGFIVFLFFWSISYVSRKKLI